MKKVKVLIVDDEPLAHTVLEDYASKLEFIDVVGNCYDSISTINFLDKHKVDVILLDIQLPDLTGLELLNIIEKRSPKIIFTTAYTEYAFQSYDYNQVIDYLHKPIRLNRFIKAIDRLKIQLELDQRLSNSEQQAEPEISIPSRTYISIKDNRETIKINYSDITHIQSWGNYLKFHLNNGKIQLSRKTLKELDLEVPEQIFQRVHKSYIVNREYVTGIKRNQVVLEDNLIPIGKSYELLVKKKLI